MTFEEVYQQIRKMHYEILDERESISKSARLSLSTWVLDILTEYRMAIEALEREPSEDLISRAEAIEEPKKKAKVIDHGKIVACYKGGRSPQWIADDMGISWQTVVNHLEKEGIYKKI